MDSNVCLSKRINVNTTSRHGYFQTDIEIFTPASCLGGPGFKY